VFFSILVKIRLMLCKQMKNPKNHRGEAVVNGVRL
jgi:hypothetical protein